MSPTLVAGRGAGGGRTLVQKPIPSQLPPVGKSFWRLRKRATWRNSTVSSDSHLKIGQQWSDQHGLDCFKYSWSSVPGLVCFHFFEAHSLNCGNLCHGCSLVIMQLTSSTWWGFQYLQNSSQDMAQNIIHSPWGRTGDTWLCLMTKLFCCLVSFDYLPLFLHYLTSLIKLILWLKFFRRQEAGREHREQGP